MNNERFKLFAEEYFNAEVVEERFFLDAIKENVFYFYKLNDGTTMTILEKYDCEKKRSINNE